jgi:hypothetical protein
LRKRFFDQGWIIGGRTEFHMGLSFLQSQRH